ncbi:Beta/gamma crystallin [Neofusicoccum parvum]|uniref:Beta/gamma crystallin n=1 Tax=Neofusicoccum parvum TaxID=310453 RepID=A0ACB5RPA3_9PEZI|nr:Beta/gamma crystallin [Neofusicoccum parvum]
MHFPTLTTATTLLLATLALSAPATTPFATETNITTTHSARALPVAETLAKRAVYNNVRYCQYGGGGGACLTQAFKHAVCYNFSPWWNGRVSSLYPAPNTRCRLHERSDCRGRNVGVGPNRAAVDLKWSGLDDRASSIDCWSSMG